LPFRNTETGAALAQLK